MAFIYVLFPGETFIANTLREDKSLINIWYKKIIFKTILKLGKKLFPTMLECVF